MDSFFSKWEVEIGECNIEILFFFAVVINFLGIFSFLDIIKVGVFFVYKWCIINKCFLGIICFVKVIFLFLNNCKWLWE